MEERMEDEGMRGRRRRDEQEMDGWNEGPGTCRESRACRERKEGCGEVFLDRKCCRVSD